MQIFFSTRRLDRVKVDYAPGSPNQLAVQEQLNIIARKSLIPVSLIIFPNTGSEAAECFRLLEGQGQATFQVYELVAQLTESQGNELKNLILKL